MPREGEFNTAFTIDLKIISDVNELQARLKKLEAEINKSEDRIAAGDKRFTQKALERKLADYKKTFSKISKVNWVEHKKALDAKTKQDKAYLDNLVNLSGQKQKQMARDADAQQRKSQKSYVSKWKAAFSTVTRYFSAYQVLNLAIKGGTDIVSDFLEIDKTLARVSVIAGKTKASVSGLRDTMYTVSSAFGISAKEVSKFVFQMSKLGKSPDEIRVLAKEAAQLSVVLGEDMAVSGQLIVTTMNQFGLVTSEASRVTTTFFNTIRKSPLAIKDLQTTMQYVGTAADAAGIEVEELGIMMQELSNRGLRASKIGTGLRNVILKLAKDGRDFREVMDEMSESGISLAEALELFGKRGAVAGYTLITQWEEMQQMFSHDIPTSIEATVETMRATNSIVTTFTKSWESLKKAVFGGETDEEVELAEELNHWIGFFNVDITKANEKLRELIESGDALPENLFRAIFSEEEVKNAEKMFVTARALNSRLGEFNDALGRYAESISKEQEQRASIAEVVRRFAGEGDDLAKAINEGDKTVDQARKSLEEWESVLKAKFIRLGLSTKEAGQKARNEVLKAINVISQEDLDVTAQVRVKELKETIAEINRLVKEFEAGGIKDDPFIAAITPLREKKDELCKLFKGTIYEAFCKDPVKAKSQISKLISDILAQMRDAFADAEKQLAISQFGDKTVTETKTAGLRGFVTPSQFFTGKDDQDPEVVAEEYRKYLDELISKVKADIIDTAAERGAEFGTLAASKREAAVTAVDAVKKLLLGDISDEERQRLERELVKLKTVITKIDTDLVKDVGKVQKNLETANEALDEKDVSATGLLERLLFGKEDDGKDKAEKINAILDAAANFLGEIADIYKSWSDEMFNQLNDRLDAEKESIQVRYDFEKDAIRLAAENNLLTQEQYSIRSSQLEKERLSKMNALAKKQFEAKKKQDIKNAIIDGNVKAATAFITAFTANSAQPAFGAIMGAIAMAIVGAQSIIRVNAIKKREFTPVQFAEGGQVEGLSHSEGGIPFSVAGSGGYEMEGGEYIVKKSSVNKDTLPLLDAINNDKRYDASYFENGGMIKEGESTSGAQTVVRAYITEKDLDAFERNRESRENKRKLFG